MNLLLSVSAASLLSWWVSQRYSLLITNSNAASIFVAGKQKRPIACHLFHNALLQAPFHALSGLSNTHLRNLDFK